MHTSQSFAKPQVSAAKSRHAAVAAAKARSMSDTTVAALDGSVISASSATAPPEFPNPSTKVHMTVEQIDSSGNMLFEFSSCVQVRELFYFPAYTFLRRMKLQQLSIPT